MTMCTIFECRDPSFLIVDNSLPDSEKMIAAVDFPFFLYSPFVPTIVGQKKCAIYVRPDWVDEVSKQCGIVLTDFYKNKEVDELENHDYKLKIRCFVEDKKILTYSIYEKDGETNLSYKLTNDELKIFFDFFTSTIFKNDSLVMPKATVLDFGLVGTEWTFIRFQAPWNARFYNCDLSKALRVVWKSCRGYD